MVSSYDYFIIAVYFAFILIVGLVFRKLSKNTSDYFRCCGGGSELGTTTLPLIAQSDYKRI